MTAKKKEIKNYSELTCFVMMPISNHDDYSDGHFNRVYEHLIKPACIDAGFLKENILRADEVNKTNYIVIDIINQIISADMVICDLSSLNPNVMYELGIRQSFDKPVTLIKDSTTRRLFDIQGFRDFEYCKELRIDNVQKEIIGLSTFIKENLEPKSIGDFNSLISILNISKAETSNTSDVSNDTKTILNALNNLYDRIGSLEARSKVYSSGAQKIARVNLDSTYLLRLKLRNIKAGDKIEHTEFGVGLVVDFNKSNERNKNILVDFEHFGKVSILSNDPNIVDVIQIR